MIVDLQRRRLEMARDHYLEMVRVEQGHERRLLSLAGQHRGLVRAWYQLLAAGHRKRAKAAALELNRWRGALNALPDPKHSTHVTTPDQARRLSIRDHHRRRTDKW